jgi:hypothetical protein
LILGFFLSACARPAAERDAGGALTDTPRADAPTVDAGTDASAPDAAIADAAGADAGGTDVRSSDVGSSDAGTPPGDAPRDAPVAGEAGSSCARPIDVSVAGTYTVDTCAFSNFVASGCGAADAHDVVLGGESPLSGSSYGVRVPDGWVIDQTDRLCEASAFTCSATGMYFVTGTRGDPFWYFVISRRDGGCGMVDVIVERMM